MPKNDIGGFFLSIGAAIDKASFEASNRLIDGLGNSFNKLIGSARNAANTLATTTLDTAKVGDSVQRLSDAWNVSAESINLWRATAKIATTDAKSLDSALSKLADVKNGLIFGDGFNAFAEGLSKLGMGYDALDNLDPDKQFEKIINFALTSSTKDKATTAKILNDLLGTGASQLYLKLSDKGYTNVGQYQQDEVTKRIFTSGQDFLDLETFQEQVYIFDQSIDSLKTLFGATLAKNLTDPLSNLNDWLVAHGDEIALAMDKLGTAIGKIVGETGETISTAGAVTTDSFDVIKDLVTAETPEEKQAAADKGQELIDSWIENKDEGGALAAIVGTTAEVTDSVTDKIIDFFDDIRNKKQTRKDKKELEKTLKQYKKDGLEIPDYMIEDATAMGINVSKYIQDGIISPTGQVTQVAPDDWVFAARNIGDMARAFIPQNYNSVSAPSEYNIVQNFTINGGNDMPQVLRQQAYQGTQDAMLQMMEQSARRLQLMSGTR